MNNKMPMDDLIAQLAAWVEKNGSTPEARAKLARRVFDGVCGALPSNAEAAVQITAPNAVVEVVDAETGRLYRRYLELAYEENDNGLRLSGEDMAANCVQIVFLSEAALAKMNDLRGNGPDAPRCGNRG